MVLRTHRAPGGNQAAQGHANRTAQRVADNALAKKLLKWEPKVAFKDGLKRTIDWYFQTKDREK